MAGRPRLLANNILTILFGAVDRPIVTPFYVARDLCDMDWGQVHGSFTWVENARRRGDYRTTLAAIAMGYTQ